MQTDLDSEKPLRETDFPQRRDTSLTDLSASFIKPMLHCIKLRWITARWFKKTCKTHSEKKEGRKYKDCFLFRQNRIRNVWNCPMKRQKSLWKNTVSRSRPLNTLIRERMPCSASFLLHRWWRRMQSMDNQERNDSTGSRRRHSLWLFCQVYPCRR